jgi:2-aminoadipate transaminase
MAWNPQLDASAEMPLYRQLYEQMALAIRMGSFCFNDKLPPTRELAGQLGLNRTTVSAAYALLEENGLIRAEVGRGSYVSYQPEENGKTNFVQMGSFVQKPAEPNTSEWLRARLEERKAGQLSAESGSRSGSRSASSDVTPLSGVPTSSLVSFASSRPAEDHFPVESFQDVALDVIGGPEAANILQLGPPNGYTPLREFLLEQARRRGEAGPDDDVLITSGCQQALDLLQRTFGGTGSTIAVEDPVYHGLKNAFERGGARLAGVAIEGPGASGLDVADLGRVLVRERPSLLLLTPNFQNPTGLTLDLEGRAAALRLTRDSGTLLVENDIYGDLRYRGEALPTIKQLEPEAGTLLLRSFSKVAFPGLRVGWIVGPRSILARLADTKQWCDLHSDQLSQAILLRFASSGRLEAHLERVRKAGAKRLEAVLDSCARHLPPGCTFTRPDGGMSLWLRVPEGIDTEELLPRAQREGVSYLPGRQFAISRPQSSSLRISFGGLAPEAIERGIAILGSVLKSERQRRDYRMDSAPALV